MLSTQAAFVRCIGKPLCKGPHVYSENCSLERVNSSLMPLTCLESKEGALKCQNPARAEAASVTEAELQIHASAPSLREATGDVTPP